MTYAHVHRHSDKHRLPEENLEWTQKDLLKTLSEGELLLLERSPISVVASLLAQLLRTLHEQIWTVEGMSIGDRA